MLVSRIVIYLDVLAHRSLWGHPIQGFSLDSCACDLPSARISEFVVGMFFLLASMGIHGRVELETPFRMMFVTFHVPQDSVGTTISPGRNLDPSVIFSILHLFLVRLFRSYDIGRL